MPKYRRVTLCDRIQIQASLRTGSTIRQIAQALGFHPTTIYRERHRNCFSRGYRAGEAQYMAEERFKNCRRPFCITAELQHLVEKKLYQRWSPEEIAGRLKKERGIRVSHQSIYRFIRRDPARHQRFKYFLRRPYRAGMGRYLRRKRKNENLLRIFHRPAIADQRKRIGDWERDTMYCHNREMILVCTDRKTRFTCFNKLPNFQSRTVYQKTMELLEPLRAPIYTMTNDNAPEFRDADLFGRIPVYYCDPKSPHQRGTIENTIGLIRQYIKKTTNLKRISAEQLKRIEFELNLRPRKCLDYQTPYEAFFNQAVALAM